MRANWILNGFPDAFEKEFRQEDLRFSLNLTRFYLLSSGLMFGFFPLVVLLLPPDFGSGIRPTAFMNIRNIIVPVFALICYSATYWKRYLAIAGYLNSFYVLLFLTGITGWMALSTPDSPAYLLHFASLVLGCVILNIGGHLRLPYVAVTGALIIAEFVLASIVFEKVLDTRTGAASFTHNLLFLFAAYIFGLASNLASEYYRRNLFLMRKRIRLEEAAARRKSFEEWKEAYSIFHKIHGQGLSKKRKPAAGAASSGEAPAVRYVDKMKNDRLADLVKSFDARKGYGHVFDRILEFVIDISGSQWGAIAVRNDRTGEPEYIARRGTERRKNDFIMRVVAETCSTGKPVVVNLARGHGDPIYQEMARENGIRSLLCFPVFLRGAAIGACYLDKGRADEGFSGESDDLIISLVTQVVLSVDEPYRRDEGIPAEIDETVFGMRCDALGFTPREREIALNVVRGMPKRKICNKLFITENTYRSHMKNINSKAGVETRAELLRALRGDQFDRPYLEN